MLLHSELCRSGEWFAYGGIDTYEERMDNKLRQLGFEPMTKTSELSDVVYQAKFYHKEHTSKFVLIEVAPATVPKEGNLYVTTVAFGNDSEMVLRSAEGMSFRLSGCCVRAHENNPKAVAYGKLLTQALISDLERRIPYLEKFEREIASRSN